VPHDRPIKRCSEYEYERYPYSWSQVPASWSVLATVATPPESVTNAKGVDVDQLRPPLAPLVIGRVTRRYRGIFMVENKSMIIM
jgi:hypothetical protein